jgi:hypothetical protein
MGPAKTVVDLVAATMRDLLKQQENAIHNYELGDSLFAPFFNGKLIIGTCYAVQASPLRPQVQQRTRPK